MRDCVFNADGSINQNPNLDGLMAEQHHAGTFNIDAATKESDLHARALESNGKNSVDLQVYDKDGKVVKRYQSKYGKDAEASEQYFEHGDYRGQRKMVPDGQAEEIPGSTDHMDAGGVQSKPLSKGEAKRMQERAQKEGEIQQYEWNDANKVAITKAIGKKAAIAGVLAVGFQGARIAGRRFWNWITGKPNQSIDEDMKEFVASSIQSAGGTGLAVATTGGITVAVKNGWERRSRERQSVISPTPSASALRTSRCFTNWAKAKSRARKPLTRPETRRVVLSEGWLERPKEVPLVRPSAHALGQSARQ